jgi:hypothetical protein
MGKHGFTSEMNNFIITETKISAVCRFSMLHNVTLNAMAFISIMQGTNLVYQLDFLYLSHNLLLHAYKFLFSAI